MADERITTVGQLKAALLDVPDSARIGGLVDDPDVIDDWVELAVAIDRDGYTEDRIIGTLDVIPVGVGG